MNAAFDWIDALSWGWFTALSGLVLGALFAVLAWAAGRVSEMAEEPLSPPRHDPTKRGVTTRVQPPRDSDDYDVWFV